MASVLAAGLALCGCGGGGSSHASSGTTGTDESTTSGSTQASSSGRSESLPSTTIEATIPGLLRESRIPERYTCDGSNTSLPVRWSNIPAGTVELAMFLLRLRPLAGRTFYDWEVVGLNPAASGVSAGTLPAGAVVGRNSFGKVGYSICPARGAGEEHYILRVIALQHALTAKPGFNAEALFNEAERSTKVVGITGGVYTRR